PVGPTRSAASTAVSPVPVPTSRTWLLGPIRAASSIRSVTGARNRARCAAPRRQAAAASAVPKRSSPTPVSLATADLVLPTPAISGPTQPPLVDSEDSGPQNDPAHDQRPSPAVPLGRRGVDRRRPAGEPGCCAGLRAGVDRLRHQFSAVRGRLSRRCLRNRRGQRRLPLRSLQPLPRRPVRPDSECRALHQYRL